MSLLVGQLKELLKRSLQFSALDISKTETVTIELGDMYPSISLQI